MGAGAAAADCRQQPCAAVRAAYGAPLPAAGARGADAPAAAGAGYTAESLARNFLSTRMISCCATTHACGMLSVVVSRRGATRYWKRGPAWAFDRAPIAASQRIMAADFLWRAFRIS